MQGRDMLLPEDLQAVGIAVMAHRLGHDLESTEPTGRVLAQSLLRDVAVPEPPVAGRSLQPRVWVLPNSRAPGLAAAGIAMWNAGASQGKGAADLLCFVLRPL